MLTRLMKTWSNRAMSVRPRPVIGAGQGIIDEDEWGGPDSYIEIELCRMCYLRARIERGKTQTRDWYLQSDETKPDRTCKDQGADEGRALFGIVAASIGLRGQPGCPHAQETEAPEEKIENDRGGGNGAKEMRRTEAPGHGCIGDAEQRGREMRERHRQSEPHHPRMADFYAPSRRSTLSEHCACSKAAGPARPG